MVGLCVVASGASAGLRAQADARALTLGKAAYVNKVTNDQRTALVPPAGQRFLWVTAKATRAPQVIDLTKVAVVSGTTTAPLIGVDSIWDGDPKEFSMIAPAQKASGGTIPPPEETKSAGSTAFAFTPGKGATLTINAPSSVCLLFAVPSSMQGGRIKGLDAKDLQVPPAAAAPK